MIFLFVLLLAAWCVILTTPVRSVFFLVTCFSLTSVLLVSLNIQFMGLLFLIVYVGGIAVLFLFVLMFLNLRHEKEEKPEKLFFNAELKLIFFLFLFFFFFFFIFDLFSQKDFFLTDSFANYSSLFFAESGLRVLGHTLFTWNSYPFVMAGFILLVALVGSILLTLRNQTSKIILLSADTHVSVTANKLQI